jgi:hypothetical protein
MANKAQASPGMQSNTNSWYLVVVVLSGESERPCSLTEMAKYFKAEAGSIGPCELAFFAHSNAAIGLFVQTSLPAHAILSRLQEPKAFGRGSVFTARDKLLCIEIGESLAERGFNTLRHWNEKRIRG